ncbi:hypothetical protein AK830_g4275 [Neonectria ditissima]|uniref:Uncharacterized protein n=1 Tax=Neonectria ditissima TaxID=78410 RepID=A0A0P7BP95_9HYPO|nr:hypothetical protein AK830_g4275 [Neonectria ditissima]
MTEKTIRMQELRLQMRGVKRRHDEDMRQNREKAKKKLGTDALERLAAGNIEKHSYTHNQQLIKYIAKARYDEKDSRLAKLPLPGILKLTRSFKLSEWQAIEEQPDLDQALKQLQSSTELGNWVSFWKNVNEKK